MRFGASEMLLSPLAPVGDTWVQVGMGKDGELWMSAAAPINTYINPASLCESHSLWDIGCALKWCWVG